ncbi:hypothetical protein FDC26_17715 [Clostridium botulinum]|uniref:hypothetical protein n=1 Tax=unclassified Clostridium TaxID=2614128 RepID=UPI0013C9F456|nr:MULTISPECIES: hypothetical protein [unclassified Clostridium]NFN78675.1 hypothetical protein [Clostridium botulinum]NFO79215.1 hypothetical protein [Clostridium botulinum]NFP05979.1 hypothetical protein [Clostridium botulinum]NFS02266.1 hypothetical protein [Clostridium botulinum]NFT97356.1 hypothetical protein [Clostridium botulinum]
MSPDFIISKIQEVFNGFNDTLNDAIKLITQSPQSNPELWGVVDNVQSIVLSVAFTLAVLYFFIDFLNKSVMLEYMRWENVVKSLLKLLVCKEILTHTMDLMLGIFRAVAEIITQLGVDGAVTIPNLNYDAMKSSMDGMNLFSRLGMYINMQPVVFLIMLAGLIIQLIVFGRMIQVCVYTAFAPIPLASLAGEGFQGSAKRFIKKYVGVCFQGAVMILALGLYGATIKGQIAEIGTFAGLSKILLMTLVLLFLLVKSGDWSNQIIGD